VKPVELSGTKRWTIGGGKHQRNSKNKNIRDLCRGVNEFKKGYQPRTNIVKDENGDLLADFHVF
jgi:hypothetical protein